MNSVTEQAVRIFSKNMLYVIAGNCTKQNVVLPNKDKIDCYLV